MSSTTVSEPQVFTFDVVYKHPKELKPYFRNAKKHSRKQVTDLANAIRRVGFDQPIVVDADFVIIKGHGRRLASLEVGLELVPVVIRTDLTPEEVMAARIADNHTHTLSSVDEKMEKVEIDAYLSAGGEFGKEFFDFLGTGEKEKPPAAAATVQSTKKVDVAGALLNCPKCSHSFMETKE